MNIRASRSAIATQPFAARQPDARATRSRITIKTARTFAHLNDSVPKPAQRVLFVAGDSMHTQLIRMVLSKHDMTVTAFSHAGASAAAMSIEVPDVVLLDWDTAGVDGEAVLRGLRGNPDMRRVPVILLTNRGVPADIRRELGGYNVQWILEKPIVAMSLPKLIERTILNASRSSAGESGACQYQRSALLIECGQTASGAAWKAVW